MNEEIDISQFIKVIDKLNHVYPKLPDLAATIAVNFSKQRFISQNWLDQTAQPWYTKSSRLPRNAGRKILVQSGRLKRSPRKMSVTPTTALIGSDVPYAAVQNYGFSGVQHVKSFRRRNRKSGKTSEVRPFNRTTTIPRNQFMGNSAALSRNIIDRFTQEFTKVLS